MTHLVKFDNDLLLHVHVYDKKNVFNKSIITRENSNALSDKYNDVHVYILPEKEV